MNRHIVISRGTELHRFPLDALLCVSADGNYSSVTTLDGRETPESFHDFAQALADLVVNNAIYLVGSTAYGFWRDHDGVVEEFSERRVLKYRYENYFVSGAGIILDC